MKWKWVAIFSVIFLTGCESFTATGNRLNRDIHDKTAQINDAAQSADRHVTAAAGRVAVASTQPGNPPITTALLADTSKDLSAAHTDIGKITPATMAIDRKSDSAAKNAAAAEKEVTDHPWLGYLSRRWLWAISLLAVPAVIAFAVETNGAGPIAAAALGIGGGAIRFIWGWIIKPIGTVILHVFTLGGIYIGRYVNQHWEAQQPAAKALASK